MPIVNKYLLFYNKYRGNTRFAKKKTSLVLVDKRGFFGVKERAKVHQAVERTPKSTPVNYRSLYSIRR